MYIRVISPIYSYSGFTAAPTDESYVTSWIVLGIMFLIVIPFVKSTEFVKSNAAILLFILFFLPWTSLIYYKPQPTGYILWEVVYWAMTFILLRIRFSVKLFNTGNHRSESFIYFITFVLITTIVYISAFYANFRIKLDLQDVYDLRMDSRAFNLPKIIEYVWSATTNILPIVLVYFMSKKKWNIVMIIAFAIVLNFSINGQKSTMFKLLLCFLLYFFMKSDMKAKVPIFVTGLVLVGLFEHDIWETDFVALMVVRRVSYVTSLLDSYYYDVIHQYGPIFYSHKLNGTDIQFYIGDMYFGEDEMRANNGLFSDAFMNLGYVGCFFYPFIYAILFNFLENVTEGLNKSISFYTTFLIVFTLRSSEFTTALLTHGLLLLILTIAFMPRISFSSSDNY